MTNTKLPLLAILVSAIVIVLMMMSDPALAGTQADYQALRDWCVGRDKWTAEGRKTDYPHPPEYFHFHHYCGAMQSMRALYAARDSTRRRAAADSVVGEVSYLIGHVPESHFLMPDAYAIRGQAQAMVNRNVEAETSLLKALELDPRHGGAYSTLANLYMDTNRKARAIQTVEAGLAVDPDRKSLKLLAEKLGVKTAPPSAKATFVDPATPDSERAKSEPLSVSKSPPAAGEPRNVAPEAANAPDKPAPPTAPNEPVKPPKLAPDAVGHPPGVPKTGASQNPSCRFCPEK